MFWNASNCYFSVLSPAFHIHLVVAQPTVYQGYRSRVLSTAENEMAGIREGRLAQTSHPARGRLHQEVLVEDEQAGAWALPVSLPFIHLHAFFTLGPCFKFTFSEAHSGYPSLFPNAFPLEPRISHLHFISPWFLSVYFFILLSAPKRKFCVVGASEPVWFNVVSPAENDGRVHASHRSRWTLEWAWNDTVTS